MIFCLKLGELGDPCKCDRQAVTCRGCPHAERIRNRPRGNRGGA
jgi:hypothetical protein